MKQKNQSYRQVNALLFPVPKSLKSCAAESGSDRTLLLDELILTHGIWSYWPRDRHPWTISVEAHLFRFDFHHCTRPRFGRHFRRVKLSSVGHLMGP